MDDLICDRNEVIALCFEVLYDLTDCDFITWCWRHQISFSLISCSLNAAVTLTASRDEPEAAIKERKSSRLVYSKKKNQPSNPTNSRIFNMVNRGMLVAMGTLWSSH